METEEKSWVKKYVPWIIPVLFCFWIPTILLYTPAYQNVAFMSKIVVRPNRIECQEY